MIHSQNLFTYLHVILINYHGFKQTCNRSLSGLVSSLVNPVQTMLEKCKWGFREQDCGGLYQILVM